MQIWSKLNKLERRGKEEKVGGEIKELEMGKWKER